MAIPLTTLTQAPVRYSTFSFGGDDTKSVRSGLFGTIVNWDLNENQESFKAHVVFFIKKAFAFLDAIGIGCCLCGSAGLKGKLESAEWHQKGPERNREARERIVNAFGGEAACRTFRVVQLQTSDFTDYLKLGDGYFNSGESIVQGEDPAGRKFAAMRLVDQTGRLKIMTVHQRYRETCISSWSGGGALWTANSSDDREMVRPNTDDTVAFVQSVCQRRHPELVLAPKP